MKTEYLTKLKQEVTQRFYRDITTGKLNIETPFGNLRNMPFEIIEIENSGIAYNPFATYSESRQAYNYAMSALAGFRQHLQANDVPKLLAGLGVCRPRIAHRYLTPEKNPLEPQRERFKFDPRIIVSPVGILARKYLLKIKSFFGDQFYHTSFKYNIVESSEALRRYSVTPNPNSPGTGTLHVSRSPIILNADKENPQSKISALPLEVLCALLEPATTARMCRISNDTAEYLNFNSPQEHFGELIKSGVKEERTIAKVIIYEWLKVTQGKKSITEDESAEFDACLIDKDDEERAKKQVEETGIFSIINYYYSKQWNFKKFLDGSWERHLI